MSPTPRATLLTTEWRDHAQEQFRSAHHSHRGRQDYTIYTLEALDKRGFDLDAPAVLDQGDARERAAARGRRDRDRRPSRGAGAMERTRRTREQEFAFMPARVLLQDFTGVPVVADLAAMRDAIKRLGGDPAKINPLQPADLVIDHSVQVDAFGTARRRSRSNARARVRAQPGALPVPALGPARVQQFPRGAARHRDRSSGESRIPGAGGLHLARRRGLSRTRSSAPIRIPR